MQEAGILQRLYDSARASGAELALMALLGLAVVGAGLLVLLRSSDPPAPAVEKVSPSPAAVAASPTPTAVVHVAGQVAAPGVYSLPEGSRVQDAVNAAGGPAAEADLNALNLAAPVSDGQKVTVPKPGEAVPEGSGDGGAGSAGPINLNTATAARLEDLPGVGPVLAQRIVDHRARRRFTSKRQLMEVSGFGPKKYEAVQDLISV